MHFIAGVEGKLSRTVNLAPHLHKKLKFWAHSTYFKLSECINCKHNTSPNVQFSFLHGFIGLVAGMGASCQGQFIVPPPQLHITS